MILILVKYYLEAKVFTLLPEKHVRKIRIQQFRKIFEWAREHSEFYKTIYTEAGVMDLQIKTEADIQKVPIVDKAMMKKFGLDSLLTCVKKEQLAVNRTSGSNGVPFAVYSSKREHFTGYVRSFMALKGYNPFKRFALIGVSGDREKIEKGSFLQIFQKHLGLFRRETFSVLTSPGDLIEKLREKDIHYLSSTPTCLQVLAEELKKKGEKLNIPYIITSGETLKENIRNEFVNRFNAKVINVYGCMELPSMAWTGPNGQNFNYNLNTVLPEYMDSRYIDGELYGDFVFTNFINRTMPFIRYRVGDQVKISDSFNQLGEVMGRADDILHLNDGRKLHVVQLYVFSLIEGLAQYKFLQKKNGTIYFYAICDPLVNKVTIESDIYSTWRNHFGDHPFEVEFKSQLAVNPNSGKFKRIEVEKSGSVV